MSLYEILYTLFINIAPGIGAIFAFKKGLFKDPQVKFIAYLLLISFSIELFAEIHYYLELGRNVFLNSISNILMISIISKMIYDFTERNRLVKFVGLFFTISVFVFLVFIEGFNNYAPLAYSIAEIGIITLCLLYFHYIFSNETEIFIDRNIAFIIVCIVLVFNCGSLFTSILIQRITENLESYGLYDLQFILDGLVNSAFIWVLWKASKNNQLAKE